MSKEAVFLKSILYNAEVSRMSAMSWGRLTNEVIEPVLDILAFRAKHVFVSDTWTDLYHSSLPDKPDAPDAFLSSLSSEEIYNCVKTGREEASLRAIYEQMTPNVVMPEDIAKRIIEGSPPINEAAELLSFAQEAVDTASNSIGDFLEDGDDEKRIIYALVDIAKNIVEHVMLNASLDIDSNIEDCRDIVNECKQTLVEIDQILNYTPDLVKVTTLDTYEPEPTSEESIDSEEDAEGDEENDEELFEEKIEPEEDVSDEPDGEEEESVDAEEAEDEPAETPEDEPAEEAVAEPEGGVEEESSESAPVSVSEEFEKKEIPKEEPAAVLRQFMEKPDDDDIVLY